VTPIVLPTISLPSNQISGEIGFPHWGNLTLFGFLLFYPNPINPTLFANILSVQISAPRPLLISPVQDQTPTAPIPTWFADLLASYFSGRFFPSLSEFLLPHPPDLLSRHSIVPSPFCPRDNWPFPNCTSYFDFQAFPFLDHSSPFVPSVKAVAFASLVFFFPQDIPISIHFFRTALRCFCVLPNFLTSSRPPLATGPATDTLPFFIVPGKDLLPQLPPSPIHLFSSRQDEIVH